MATAVLSSSLPYFPSEKQAESFWKALPQDVPEIVRVPFGFPKKLLSPLAWKAKDIQAHLTEYVVELSPEDVDNVESALAAFKSKYSVS
jgi:hypothetical protein